MALAAQDGSVAAGQREDGAVVIEIGRSPAAGGVAGFATGAEAATVRIGVAMAG